MNTPTVKLGIVDDHVLFRNGVIKLIESYTGGAANYCPTVEAASGEEFIESLKRLPDPERPDIVFVDLNMPEMDGFQTILHLRQLYPSIIVIVLTMRDDDEAIIRSLKLGASGFLTKNIEKKELKEAIDSCLEKGYYYPGHLTKRLVHNLAFESTKEPETAATEIILSEKEKEFVRLACTDLTYAEIAEKMYLSARTVDGYRNTLFAKTHVTSRVGLAMWAIRNRLVHP
jgi:two-component system invasion response regulator UvrY